MLTDRLLFLLSHTLCLFFKFCLIYVYVYFYVCLMFVSLGAILCLAIVTLQFPIGINKVLSIYISIDLSIYLACVK